MTPGQLPTAAQIGAYLLELNAYGRSVMAVVDTIEAFEHRNWEAVLADMLATEPKPAPQTPPVPVS
jgi:hypothetical protein